jgi:hypothetical protein
MLELAISVSHMPVANGRRYASAADTFDMASGCIDGAPETLRNPNISGAAFF